MSRQTLDLLHTFTLREIRTRYSGSVMGLAWAWIGPITMLLIYAFVFGNILKPGAQALDAPNYLLFVASALWPWMIFSDGLMRGMGAIHANASLVRKVAFPHAVLVLASLASAAALHFAGYIVVLAGLAYLYGGISLTGVLAALPTLLSLFIFTLGLALLFAGLQTLMRDVEQAMNPALAMLQFLTPVMYPLSIIPQPYRDWMSWNPLAIMITRIRQQLFNNDGWQTADLIIPIIALVTLAIGYAVFKRLSPHFEDFL